MTQRIVYKSHTPSWVRQWDPDTDDAVLGFHTLIPLVGSVVPSLVVTILAGMICFLVVPGSQEAFLEKFSLAMPLALLALYGWFHAYRLRFVEHRTEDATLIAFCTKYDDLPRELQAEAAPLREQAIRFSKDANLKGVESCWKALEELVKAHAHRTSLRHQKEVQEVQEPKEVMERAMQYRSETIALFAGELEAGRVEPEEDDEVHEGELEPDPCDECRAVVGHRFSCSQHYTAVRSKW